jgi:hypothetical protein
MNKDKNPSSDAEEQQSCQSSALVQFVNKENPQSGTLLERIYADLTGSNSNVVPTQPRRMQIFIQLSVRHGLPFVFSISETMSGGYNFGLTLGTHHISTNISDKKVIARIIKDIVKYFRDLNELASSVPKYLRNPYLKSRLVLDTFRLYVKFACLCIGTTQKVGELACKVGSSALEVGTLVKEGVVSAKIYVEKAVKNAVKNAEIQAEINSNNLEFLAEEGEDETWDFCDLEEIEDL